MVFWESFQKGVWPSLVLKNWISRVFALMSAHRQALVLAATSDIFDISCHIKKHARESDQESGTLMKI